MLITVVVTVAILVVSVVIHENAHGWTALALGDQTAKASGRLSLNPIKHIDPVGSVIMPAFMAVAGAGVFGWAKPVPVDPRKLRGADRGFAIVALAGPASNLVLAFLAVAVRDKILTTGSFAWEIAFRFALVNVFLAVFNLVPIPPLDGSRLLRLFLRPKGLQVLDKVEPYGFLILIGVLVLLPGVLQRITQPVMALFVRLLGVA